MPNIPAICINPQCKAIFSSGIAIENSSNITFSGCLAGPCPKCKGTGKIPDGKYDAIGSTLFASLKNITDIEVLKKSLQIIKQHFNSGKTPDEIKEKVKKEIPELNTVWGLIPKTRIDAYIFIGLIISFLTLLVLSFPALKSDSPDTINIQQNIINQSFEAFYSQTNSLQLCDQPDSDIEKQKDQTE